MEGIFLGSSKGLGEFERGEGFPFDDVAYGHADGVGEGCVLLVDLFHFVFFAVDCGMKVFEEGGGGLLDVHVIVVLFVVTVGGSHSIIGMWLEGIAREEWSERQQLQYLQGEDLGGRYH